MNQMEKQAQALVDQTQDLLRAVQSGDLDQAERLAGERHRTLEQLAESPPSDRSAATQALLDQSWRLDVQLCRAAKSSLEATHKELRDTRAERRGLAAFCRRRADEPRFISRRA